MSDEGSFLKDEWGPWISREVQCNDPITSEVITQEVLRSDPAGVDLLSSYPSIEDFPGMEEWLDLDKWKGNQVFAHMNKWDFHKNSKQARDSWENLHAWHLAHRDPNEDVELGDPISLNYASLLTSPMSWSKMWEIIFRDVEAGNSSTGRRERDEDASSSSNAKPKMKPNFLHPRSKQVDREALSKSTNMVELNRVTNPLYTEKDQRVALVKDPSHAEAYIQQNVDTPGALFLIRLKHCEGEFAVGLGRRTFDEAVDDAENGVYQIEWFERKNKKENNWGIQPGFRLAISGYHNRKPIFMKSTESIKDFMLLVVQVTKRSKGSDHPVLSQDTMQALRATMLKESKSKSDVHSQSDEVEEQSSSDEGFYAAITSDNEDEAESECEEEEVEEWKRVVSQPSKRKCKV